MNKHILKYQPSAIAVLMILLCWMFSGEKSQASIHYDFNASCIDAYNEIIALNFDAGRKILEKEKSLNPDNGIIIFLENYIDFLTLSIGEEPAEYELLKPNRNERVRKLSTGDTDSPWHRHCLAGVYLQWSFIRVKFGDFALAGLDLNRAYRLIEENQSAHPGFIPDLLLSGITNALIGSIPENYRWATRLAGLHGTIGSGREKLYQLIDVAENNSHWSHLAAEAFFYLAFIEMNLQSDKQHAAKLLDRITEFKVPAQGALNCYIRANLSMKLGMNDAAIEIIEDCVISEGSYPFHYLEFVLGNAKLFRLDQQASRHFLNYVNRYKGSNYIKSAYQRLAWLSLLNGDQHGYRFYMQKVLQHGNNFVDEDKQAESEALENRIPDLNLLKARLLFDGGYFEAAIGALAFDSGPAGFASEKDSLEYVYRKARIYHEWGKTKEAKEYYLKTIEAGSRLHYFFAANAALQLGLIFENEEDFSNALHYFDLCLKMRFTEYRASIQQKARAGRQRVAQKK